MLSAGIDYSSKVTLLVYAWDNYYPAWKVFCHGLGKYWVDCPYELVFITNHLDPPCGRAIKVGDENRFYYKMNLALEQLRTPIILFMHEDYWIKQSVNTITIQRFVDLMLQDVADYIRLIPAPGPNQDFESDDKLGVIAQNAEYRVSFMASLWRVSALQKMMKPHLSLWDMEKYGVELSSTFEKRFLCVKNVNDGISYDLTAITAKQWTKYAYQYANIENIDVDFDALPLPPLKYRIQQAFIRFVYKMKRQFVKRLRKVTLPRFGGHKKCPID